MIATTFCPCCERHIKDIDMNLHHNPPKALGGTSQDTIELCKGCHGIIHYYIPINRIQEYPTINSLLLNNKMFKYMMWIRSIKHNKVWKIKTIIRKLKELE